jgi:FtsP/CotA-like multicopper oxidase with cupredoxin domain
MHQMRSVFRHLLAMLVCGFSFLRPAAQCPDRPSAGSLVQDPLNLNATYGVLRADLTLRHSVDSDGYNHYCLVYHSASGDVEAPTLRLRQGETLALSVKDRIAEDAVEAMPSVKNLPLRTGKPCGDGGVMTLNSTNVHFHGLTVSPNCHQDDVLATLIQPGTLGFEFNIPIPEDEPPGLYWYHPHVHGFTEFQVNGGAAGALIVEGMDKIRPEVAGLKERVLVIRQQFLIPWVPGPYQLTINYQLADAPNSAAPIIRMRPGEKQFWRVANATIQDFMPLQVQIDGKPEQLQLIALDGYPLAKSRFEDTILVPPGGRAEFIVQAPEGGQPVFLTQAYSTGPTGNPDLYQILANIELSKDTEEGRETESGVRDHRSSTTDIKFTGLKEQKPTTLRTLYFSEEFGGTNGPIQFYITVDGEEQKVFELNEEPVITTHVGAVEDWIVENRTLETHAFHMHQIHFLLTEVDGKPVVNQDLRDTIEIPFWEGPGHPYHRVKMRMDFRDPQIAGTFVFHCHVLLHEDLGMMHKILVLPK